MENPCSLSPHPLSIDEQETTTQEQISALPVEVSLDELLEEGLGTFSCMQLIQAILVSLSFFFDAQQSLITVFTDAEPMWHCTAKSINNGSCNSTSNVCELPKTAWAWSDPSHKTIISDWSLQCANSIVTGLPASSFFMGCLVGGFIVIILGDSILGRKNLIFILCFAMSATALATAFSPNFWIYSTLRLITGCFRGPIMTSALVLLIETVGKRNRGLVSIIGFLSFSLGLLSLPAIGYANRKCSWRLIYLWTSTPAILYCVIFYFFVTESPRWLFIHGRRCEALMVLKKLASVNNGNFNSYSPSFASVQASPSTDDLHSSMKNLFIKKWAFRRLLAIMVLAFGVGMVYYGLLLGVGQLDFNLYLGAALNCALDFPAYFLTLILLERSSRRSSILACCTLSGLSSLVCAATANHSGLEVLEIGSELVSLLGVFLAFNLLLIYMTELFPTSVRNTASSMARQTIVLGAMCSPILISEGKKHKYYSYGVFGTVITSCGMFVIGLPETRGVALSDTLDEQEKKDKLNSNSC